jgi:hypothetical protein
MQLIEHSAVAAAVWLSVDILFVIGWARLHAAERNFHNRSKATVIELRPLR